MILKYLHFSFKFQFPPQQKTAAQYVCVDNGENLIYTTFHFGQDAAIKSHAAPELQNTDRLSFNYVS